MNFRIYERKNIDENKNMKFYFIEGTAPDSVEDGINTDDTPPNGMERTRDIDKAITDIAEALVNKKSTEDVPTLVFMVHGFNNPRDASLKFFENAASQVMDPKVFPGEISRGNIVFIGYRWPSEKMLGGVLRSSVSAMPIFALCLLSFSLAAFIPKLIALIPDWFVNICNSWASNTLPNQAIDAVFAFFQSYQYVTNLSLIKTLYLLSTVSFSVFTVLALLRAIVYFRDNYRAINHGAPDLVEIIRQIDSTVLSIVDPIPRLDNTTEPIQRKRIHLSLIGHSMGGLVATNALRILTDVFDQEAIPRTLSGLPRQINKTKVSTPDLMLTHDQKRINLDHEESLIIEISKASKSEIKSHAEQEIESHDLHYKSGPVGNVFTLNRPISKGSMKLRCLLPFDRNAPTSPQPAGHEATCRPGRSEPTEFSGQAW